MELIIVSIDGPRELSEQVPFNIKLLRVMPGPDRPDYWLGKPIQPLFWLQDNREIEHVIVCARWQGTQREPGIDDLPIGIAYVTDATLLTDETLHFRKCAYVAIGTAHETSGKTVPRATDRIQVGRIAPAFGLGKSE